MLFNIYCDESCHLPNDGNNIMVIGGISCRADYVKTAFQKIRDIKIKYNLDPFMEIKWTKVSGGKLEFYKEIVQYFFDSPYLNFRAVIATGKDRLNYKKYNISHDDWYYRIYYLLLHKMIQVGNQYHIYIDIKDTRGAEKIRMLQEVLNRSLYDFFNETVKYIQLAPSHEIQLLQLTDLLIGAISYENRCINTSEAKLELIEYIKKYSGRSLKHSTSLFEEKFNLFLWNPREVTE